MLEKIYEVIADKTVGFWLIFKSDRLKNKKDKKDGRRNRKIKDGTLTF